MSCSLASDIHVYDGETLEPNAQLCWVPYRQDVKKESHVPCRNRHEPCSSEQKGAHDTAYSQAVTHPSTNPARPGLTSAAFSSYACVRINTTASIMSMAKIYHSKAI